MDVLDLVIILALCYAGLRGYRRGFTYSLFSLAGLVLGLVLGSWAATEVPSLFHGLSLVVRSLIAILLLVVLALLGHGLGGALGVRLRRSSLGRRLGPLDSMAGAAWGLLVVLAVSWYLGLVFKDGPVQPLSDQIQDSAVLGALDRDLPQGPAWLGDVQHVFSIAPFPEVFASLIPPLPGPVALPSDLGADHAISSAAARTVKVVSSGCGGLLEGSGFPVATDLVATNAHVVAGGTSVEVDVPSRSQALPAEVIFFDPETDLAVLRVPGLDLSPLTLSESGRRGTEGAVIGYPGGGPEQVVAAAARGEMQAVGRDIYSEDLVSRQIYVLQAVVIPGNSGGPFVNLKGQVLGVVFAKSLINGDEGYALTTRQVLPDIKRGETSTAVVSSGACVQ